MALEPLPLVGFGDFAIDGGLTSMWSYQENVEELRQRLALTARELEELRSRARQEQHKNKQDMLKLLEIIHSITKERDEARDQLQLLVAHLAAAKPVAGSPLAGAGVGRVASSVTESDSHGHNSYISSSPVDSFVTESAALPQDQSFPAPKYDHGDAVIEQLAKKRPLPETGGLVEAVIGAGPLLHNLIVAGPLPRWRNPPPPPPPAKSAPQLCMMRQAVSGKRVLGR